MHHVELIRILNLLSPGCIPDSTICMHTTAQTHQYNLEDTIQQYRQHKGDLHQFV